MAAKSPLSGHDLSVGGEGMHAFYDKTLPVQSNKIVGKFGAKVERGQVSTMRRIIGRDMSARRRPTNKSRQSENSPTRQEYTHQPDHGRGTDVSDRARRKTQTPSMTSSGHTR